MSKSAGKGNQIEFASLKRFDHIRFKAVRRQSQSIGHSRKTNIAIDSSENAAGSAFVVRVGDKLKTIVAHELTELRHPQAWAAQARQNRKTE